MKLTNTISFSYTIIGMFKWLHIIIVIYYIYLYLFHIGINFFSVNLFILVPPPRAPPPSPFSTRVVVTREWDVTWIMEKKKKKVFCLDVQQYNILFFIMYIFDLREIETGLYNNSFCCYGRVTWLPTRFIVYAYTLYMHNNIRDMYLLTTSVLTISVLVPI